MSSFVDGSSLVVLSICCTPSTNCMKIKIYYLRHSILTLFQCSLVFHGTTCIECTDIFRMEFMKKKIFFNFQYLITHTICAKHCVYIQSNLSTTTAQGNTKSGLCKHIALVHVSMRIHFQGKPKRWSLQTVGHYSGFDCRCISSMEIFCVTVILSSFIFLSKVLHFIMAHADTFTAILRDQHQRPEKASLEELSLLTGVVCTVMGEGN